MTARRSCPPAPGPLEDYAQRFDALFSSLAQRRGLRDYLQGLLLPRDRNKTLTGLAGTEPIIGAQHREVQRLQWFLSESAWDHEQVNDQRVRRLCEDPATAPHDGGVLVSMTPATARTAPPPPMWPASTSARSARSTTASSPSPACGPTSAAIGRCTPCPTPRRRGCRRRAGSRVPDQAAAGHGAGPGRPAGRHRVPGGGGRLRLRRQSRLHRGAGGRRDPVRAGPQASQGHLGARRPSAHPDRSGQRAWLAQTHPAWAVAAASSAASATVTPRPGGRPTPSLAAGARTGRCGWWSPPPTRPAARATAPGICSPTCPDPPAAAPSRPTWPRSCACTGCATGSSRATSRSKASWAGPTSRSAADRAIRRHWTLVCCAFSFCWQALLAEHPTDQHRRPPGRRDGRAGGPGDRVIGAEPARLVADGVASGAGLADPLERASALLAVVVASTAAPAAATAA